jgi:anti-anti-sigma factor
VTEDATREVIVVQFTGRTVLLDEVSLHDLHDSLLALAEEPSEWDLLLDFGNVECLTSTALGTLVSLHKRLLAKRRRMTVDNVSPQVHEIFAVTRLDEYLNLRPAGQLGQPTENDDQLCSPTGVLVVDDQKPVRSLLGARLRLEGFTVWSAGDGQQGIELYQQHLNEIAVALLDVLMPGMDGPHTLTALRKVCPSLRCCFMTGNPTPYTEEGLLQMGAAKVFRKPFDFKEVIGTLKQLCRSLRSHED